MRLPCLAAAFLVAAALPCGAQAPKGERLALVVGNAAYKDAPLPNPLNDAADMAKALEASGFKVIRRDNATLKEMHLALREFGDRLTRGSTGLFYFAGHGLQVRGRNYLVPVDADIAREDEVAFAALDLAAVIEKMDSARNPVNILVLDACRNNPFGTRMQITAKGLAQVEAPPGTIVAFATAPGSVAADGTGRNGLYTHHLLGEMQKPGAAIEEVFRGVRVAVRRDSQGRQIPWESTSLESAFAFRDAPKVVAAAPTAAPRPAGASAPRKLPTSIGAPPAFAKGDRWTYRSRDLLSGKDREYTLTVKDIHGDEVVYGNDTTSDLLGNPIRAMRGSLLNLHHPTSHFYVFPLKAGDVRKDLAFVQEIDKRTYDATVVLKVIGEEEVDTPAGRMRALRIERAASWKERGKDSNAGVNQWTYWYNAAVKRWVLAEIRNTTKGGKVLQHERVALVAYQVD